MDTQMLIDGRFETGTEAAEDIIDPKSGEVVASLPEASADQVEAAVAAARSAFAAWSRTTPAERSAHLLAIADRRAGNGQGRPSRRWSSQPIRTSWVRHGSVGGRHL